jgi:hypothetical protein
MTLIDAYESAAIVLSDAINREAQNHGEHGGNPWDALLPASEFHDRCMALARKSVLFAGPGA